MRPPAAEGTPPPTTRRRSRPLAVVLLALALAAAAGTANAALPGAPQGWTVVFADDFTGAAGTGVDTGRWQYATGIGYPGGPANWGTGEIETMTDSTANVYHDGAGNLAIKPIRDAAGNWTSGRVETRRADFQPPAGGKLRAQARIQMPNVTGAAAQGYWPAFWMLGEGYRADRWSWPRIGEIDILENVNGLDRVWGTLHCGSTPGGPCNETTGLGGNVACPGSSCQSGFHTYGVEWDRSVSPEQIRWYVDDLTYHTVRADQVDATTWANATRHGFYVILNVAIGGSWPGNPTVGTRSGVPMLVDYVALYSAGGTPTVPPPTPSTSPTRSAPPTPSTSPTGGGRDATATIQAEGYDGQSGTATEVTADVGGGRHVSHLANGDWLRFDNVRFGSTAARQFLARVASGATGGVSGLVEVRLDSRTSAPVGSFAIGNTGGWQSWRTVPANMAGVTGTHAVYLTFTSGQPNDFVNLNWFTFAR